MTYDEALAKVRAILEKYGLRGADPINWQAAHAADQLAKMMIEAGSDTSSEIPDELPAYEVCWHDDLDYLKKVVNCFIENGYRPLGGLAVTRDTWTDGDGVRHYENTYYQAVVREKASH